MDNFGFRPPFANQEAVFARNPEIRALYESKKTNDKILASLESMNTPDLKGLTTEQLIEWVQKGLDIISAHHVVQKENDKMKEYENTRAHVDSKKRKFESTKRNDEGELEGMQGPEQLDQLLNCAENLLIRNKRLPVDFRQRLNHTNPPSEDPNLRAIVETECIELCRQYLPNASDCTNWSRDGIKSFMENISDSHKMRLKMKRSG